MGTSHHSKVLILGSGPAGNTAAIYAARAGLEPHLIHGQQPGGQLTITTDVENYPGFADPIQGPWLMEEMSQQAQRAGTTLHTDMVISVDLNRRPFLCIGDSGTHYTAETLIICTGATAKWLGIDSEKKFQSRGVSACATCDGFFYRGREVVVVGGGNTAVEEALYLANICSKVTLIHRRDALRAEKVLQNRLFKHEKITVIWNKEINEILGDPTTNSVAKVQIKDTHTQELSEIPCAGLFIAIGHTPATKLFQGQIDMDDNGYILTKGITTATNIPGGICRRRRSGPYI